MLMTGIEVRIRRLSLGKGIGELRIDCDPDYRDHYTQQGGMGNPYFSCMATCLQAGLTAMT